MFIRHNKSQLKRNLSTRGFSAVELIVSVGIFVTLSATFLFNYNAFDRRITIDILAHQIASWVHDAQVSAMSVKRAATDSTKFPGYGLHFSRATPNKFVFFADLDKDRVYDALVGNQKCGDAGVECEKEVTLLQGNALTSLCGDAPSSAGQSVDCITVTGSTLSLYSTQNVDILFARPNPYDATLYGDAIAGVPATYGHVEVTVSSPKGYRHTISVWTTGQVAVK